MIILTDADGVLENLTQEMFRLINEKYGTSARFEDIREWDLTLCFPGLTREQVYGAELLPELYPRLRPLPGAAETLRRLMDAGHEVYVVTSTPYRAIAPKMALFMEKHYPFLGWDRFIVARRKQMIRGDVLIDDGVHNLLGGAYEKILLTKPYNAAFDAEANGIHRAADWREIGEILDRMAKERGE